MTIADLLTDAFGRISEGVHEVLDGIDPAAFSYRPDEAANTIAWLLWHLSRVQDDHVAACFGVEQVWTTAGWRERFALPFAPEEIGYGQTTQDVGAVRVADPAVFGGYHDAVHQATMSLIAGLDDDQLDRIVDDRWDPPVTLGVRLVSVVSDDLQHLGQAAYVRGLFERR